VGKPIIEAGTGAVVDNIIEVEENQFCPAPPIRLSGELSFHHRALVESVGLAAYDDPFPQGIDASIESEADAGPFLHNGLQRH
jgi:hypothetical protein